MMPKANVILDLPVKESSNEVSPPIIEPMEGPGANGEPHPLCVDKTGTNPEQCLGPPEH